MAPENEPTTDHWLQDPGFGCSCILLAICEALEAVDGER
jgi:hypothetical protein